MRTLRVAEVVLDYELYPRNNLDTSNVRTLADALAAGMELPPIIIDKKSKRVVDGFHRVKAYQKYIGDAAKINVIEKTYKNDAAIFLDAMKYNAAHGAKLDTCDRVRCVLLAEKLKIPPDQVAGALHMPLDKIGNLRSERVASSDGLKVPLKGTVREGFAGKDLTKRQQEANKKLSGMNQVFYANQLIELIESEMLYIDDESLMERLQHLYELLGGVLAKV